MRKISLFLISYLLFSPVGAQELPRSTVTYQLGLGSTNVLDTYLSQEKFSGGGLTFLSTVEREKPESRWTTRIEHQVHSSTLQDRSESRKETQFDYTLYMGRLYRWSLGNGWNIQTGAMGVGNIGAIYNSSNSNNPAQGRLSASLMPTATVSKAFCLWHHNGMLRYEANLPLVGAMFSPNYGQSYYEIFSLGNYDHNLVVTTFLTAPNFRQQLTVGYALKPYTMLTVGYLGDYQQAKANNLKSHIYCHHIMVGLVRQFSIIKHRL